jgi:hypothetical protein
MNIRFATLGLVALCAAVLMPVMPVHGQQDSALLDALVKKGVLSDQDAEDIRASEEKDYASTAASKINLSTSIKSITFYGDLRLRYELRDGVEGSQTVTSGTPSTTAAQTGRSGDSEDLNRWRYRLRLGVKGELYDNFFYGIRAATNVGYDRSGNVNFGSSQSFGPFGKGRSIMGIDQVYLGWHATPDITLTGGQFPQPFYTSNMIWAEDLNPAGALEQFDHTYDNTEVFATAGQFVYSAAAGNGITNGIGAGTTNNNVFMFGEQVGFKYKFDENTFYKGAATFYTYSGTSSLVTAGTPASNYPAATNGTLAAAGTGNTSPSFFNGPFVGSVSGPNSDVTGINDLAVLEVPMEFDFEIGPGVHTVTSGDPKDIKGMTSATTGWTLPMRIFTDFAYNVDADERADAARNAELTALAGTSNVGILTGTPATSSTSRNLLSTGKGILDQTAYEVGIEAGQLKKKGDWDTKLYWQSTGYYAIDPNLNDADIFNAAMNMQGVVVSAAYNWTDGLTSTVRYAYGMPVNGLLATPNVQQDLQEGDMKQYNLFQADLMWKF